MSDKMTGVRSSVKVESLVLCLVSEEADGNAKPVDPLRSRFSLPDTVFCLVPFVTTCGQGWTSPGLPELSISISSGDFDLEGDKKRTPLDLLRCRTLAALLLEPEMDLRIIGIEPEQEPD